MEKSKFLKGWKIENLIGEGSFGKVYKIIKEDFGYTYKAALKVIDIPKNQSEVKIVKSEGLTKESVTTYYESIVEDVVSEVVLMSKLKGNSYIVSYEDHEVVKKQDEFGWTIFIKMELLEPLYDYMESHNFSKKEVIKLGINICSALEICRKCNVIHRDIKPENIFVSEMGTFKLGDFGIARQLERTATNLSQKGTYTYMAPEVFKGFKYDSTVDIYSLGIVLYKLLNDNRAPFMPSVSEQIKYSDRENANVMRLSGEKMPKPSNADGKLAEIILKACSYDAEDRYQTPTEMKEELEKELKKFDIEHSQNSFNNAELDSEETELFVEPSNYLANSKIGSVLNKEDKENKIKSTRKGSNKKRNRIMVAMVIFVFIIVSAVVGFNIVREKNNSTKMNIETSMKSMKLTDVIGLDFEQAEDLLENTGFVVESEMQHSNEYEAGVVIDQQPKGGREYATGTTVKLIISKGPELCKVPNVIGKKKQKATKALEAVGFVVETKNVYSSKAEGVVVKQSLKAGETMVKGTTVIITVSKGKKNVSSENIQTNVPTNQKPVQTESEARNAIDVFE